MLVVFIFNLGGEVVADEADVSNLVLDSQGDLRRHGQGDGRGQTRSLGEQVQVAAGKSQHHGFLQR